MNNDFENSNLPQIAGVVIAGATETQVPFILTKNMDTGDEYASLGDLVLIKSSNHNKYVNYECLGMVIKTYLIAQKNMKVQNIIIHEDQK